MHYFNYLLIISLTHRSSCCYFFSLLFSLFFLLFCVITKGAYRDDNGKPVVLECVREAERRIAGNLNM